MPFSNPLSDVMIYAEVRSGAYIDETIQEAISMAAKHELPVRFMFSGVVLTVDKYSDVQSVKKHYYRALHPEERRSKS